MDDMPSCSDFPNITHVFVGQAETCLCGQERESTPASRVSFAEYNRQCVEKVWAENRATISRMTSSGGSVQISATIDAETWTTANSEQYLAYRDQSTPATDSIRLTVADILSASLRQFCARGEVTITIKFKPEPPNGDKE